MAFIISFCGARHLSSLSAIISILCTKMGERLILRVHDKRVFELTLRGEQDMSGDDYTPETRKLREIVFIEGPWTEESDEG